MISVHEGTASDLGTTTLFLVLILVIVWINFSLSSKAIFLSFWLFWILTLAKLFFKIRNFTSLFLRFRSGDFHALVLDQSFLNAHDSFASGLSVRDHSIHQFLI